MKHNPVESIAVELTKHTHSNTGILILGNSHILPDDFRLIFVTAKHSENLLEITDEKDE